jgi:DNA-binding transcriptional MerR regulator
LTRLACACHIFNVNYWEEYFETMPFLLHTSDLARLERERRGGVTSREVVQLFQRRGARLSAATFRKYVQAGLLPRSRRVGRKGKHSGSTGLYPVAVVRRIDLIKRMLAEGLTLEDVRESFVGLKPRLDEVEGGWGELLADVERRAQRHPRRREVARELSRAEREMRSALRRIERVGGQVATLRGGVTDAAG